MSSARVPLRHLRVFVGHQLDSEYHDESDLKALLRGVCRKLAPKRIALEATFGRFPAGENLWDSVRETIRRADLAVFDVSENNPNVMLEAGLALGSSKRILMLKSQESGGRFKRPSDLVGYVYLPYTDARSLRGPKTVRELAAAIVDYVERHEQPDRPFKDVWGFGEFDDVSVVCSELDEAEVLQHPEPWEFIYLSKYGDLDALFEAQTTIRELYPNAHVNIGTGAEVWQRRDDDRWATNLVLVGGPDYNRVTRFFERYCPVKYRPADELNNISIEVGPAKRVLTPHRDGDEIIDYGFILNRPNPHNSNRRLVMVGGCHTYGVYGAMKALRYSRRNQDTVAVANCRTLVERLGPGAAFLALLEVHGIGSSVPTPTLDPRRLWRIP